MVGPCYIAVITTDISQFKVTHSLYTMYILAQKLNIEQKLGSLGLKSTTCMKWTEPSSTNLQFTPDTSTHKDNLKTECPCYK